MQADTTTDRTAAFTRLIAALGGMEGVRAIGKTGGASLPQDGLSDVDVFVFCTEIPDAEHRGQCLRALGEELEITSLGTESGPHWGLIDFLDLQGLEVCLMYFPCAGFATSLEGILRGERPAMEGNYFYPTGRCATVLGMHVFLDRDRYLQRLKEHLGDYPSGLASALLAHHLPRINDDEDFGRAVHRQDVLFYHITLDRAIDSFLQALFALNRCYFPSRKRSLQYMEGFAAKPDDCAARLLRVVALGACPETLTESHQLWTALCADLLRLAECQSA
jgi:hypothetical protein